MDPMEINDERSLTAWLSDKPAEWAQAIALRAALRTLPYIGFARGNWLEAFALLPFGAVMTSWIQLTERSIDIFKSGSRASTRFNDPDFDFVAYKEMQLSASAADVSYHSADAQTQSLHLVSDCVEAVAKAASTFRSVAQQRVELDEDDDLAADKIWFKVQLDCLELSDRTSSGILAVQPLWSSYDSIWFEDWQRLSKRLRAIDPNYSVWTDWYEHRIRGKRSAFDIDGDHDRNEDKEILRRLAEATDEDFWEKGYRHVNATLKGWLDEARARATKSPLELSQFEIEIKDAVEQSLKRYGAPVYVRDDLLGSGNLADSLKKKGAVFVEHFDEVPQGAPLIASVPPQESGTTAYGVDDEGKLDRLPHSDQLRLRDTSVQRQAYSDLRELAMELRGDGQRLGRPVGIGLGRFIESFPEKFEFAETYGVWRDGNALRRLYWAHRKVENSLDPDPARLEPAIAEKLGGMLDLYNNFAFADDGLRAMDERRIPQQERSDAEAEAAAAAPVIEAVQKAPEIATDRARDDIVADAINVQLSADDPYAPQVLDQANRTRRNWLAAAFAWAGKALTSPKMVGKAVAVGAVTGAAGVVGKAAMARAIGYEYGPLFEFIATNGPILQNYVAVAFSSYPHLHELIERISILWKNSTRS